jgi:hypothetical protein
MTSQPDVDLEAAMIADEEMRENQREWRFEPGVPFWSRSRIDVDIVNSDSADEAKRVPTPAVYEREFDESDLSAEEEMLPEAEDESDDSDGYNVQDVDGHRDFWWISPEFREEMVHERIYEANFGVEERYWTEAGEPYGDIGPENPGMDAPEYQVHKRITKRNGRAGWPVEVALNEDEELHVTPGGLAELAEEEGELGDAHFAERWWLKPLHHERIKAQWESTRRVKPRRPLPRYNPDRPYSQLVFNKWVDQVYDWPEIKESFTTMGYAHHPDAEDEPLNDIVDPDKRAQAKSERIRRFGTGGKEIDLDLGDNVHASPSPQQIKRAFILADSGTTFDTPVVPLGTYMRGLVRYWEPTYNNACVGLRYWSYIGCASALVYFTCCRFEPYVAGLYPIEETRFYIPLTVAAISAHCMYYYGWRPLVWTYFWGQTTFASCVVVLYTYYHDYANSFEPAWDQLFLGRDFSLEHLEEEGLGLSPGGLLNYFFGSQEKLNTRAILN